MCTLENCDGKMPWPQRGVYFFFEAGEERKESGTGLRVVRVGTHAVSQNSKTTLWNRLSCHRGPTKSGGGNHRGSIFRLRVGEALIHKQGMKDYPTWGKGSSGTKEIRLKEHSLEKQVSHVIRKMPFLWLAVDDTPSKASMRGYIERHAIALLSNYNQNGYPIDSHSEGWLGKYSSRPEIQNSGLWNSNYIDESYDAEFLRLMESLLKNI